jgi:glycosyltransferase involved in cell wall biosynthesis
VILTVFTPTYNRAHLLPRLYASLCAQTNQNFIWLVVDDGSADGTSQLVHDWMQEPHAFRMEYIYKENGGMHTAHNAAYAYITTEINTCIDSDDRMPPEAVESILAFWATCRDDDTIAGFLGLDTDFAGNRIGTPFPEGIPCARYYDYYNTYGVRGDKKFVIRSAVARLYPYPVFPGEKYIGLNLKYLQLDKHYLWRSTNTVLVQVEYQPDGSSRNMWKQYRSSPRGFLHYRRVLMGLPFVSAGFRLRQALHCLPEAFFWLCRILHRGGR